jgi:hypothetical protein
MYRKLAISWTAIALALGVPQAFAGDASTQLSQTASDAVEASGLLLAGSVATIGAAGAFAVSTVQTAGPLTLATLSGLATGNSEGVELVLQAYSTTLQALPLVPGMIVRALREPAGHAFYVGDRLLAFVPNDDAGTLLRPASIQR